MPCDGGTLQLQTVTHLPRCLTVVPSEWTGDTRIGSPVGNRRQRAFSRSEAIKHIERKGKTARLGGCSEMREYAKHCARRVNASSRSRDCVKRTVDLFCYPTLLVSQRASVILRREHIMVDILLCSLATQKHYRDNPEGTTAHPSTPCAVQIQYILRHGPSAWSATGRGMTGVAKAARSL